MLAFNNKSFHKLAGVTKTLFVVAFGHLLLADFLLIAFTLKKNEIGQVHNSMPEKKRYTEKKNIARVYHVYKFHIMWLYTSLFHTSNNHNVNSHC